MEEARWLARYGTAVLVIIAGTEWLLGRTVSRLAAAPMLEGAPRAIIETFGKVGFFLVSPAFLLTIGLTMLAAVLIGRDALTRQRWNVGTLERWNVSKFAFACYLALFAVVTVAHTMFGTQLWLNISFNLMSAIAVWWLTMLAFQRSNAQTFKRSTAIGVVLIALAYTGWYVYVLGQLLGAPGSGGESGDMSIAAIRLGELAAILAPFAFFFAIAGEGRWRNPRRWIAPIIIAMLFSAGNIADAVFNQGFTGVITTWSLGLNLVWPWPIYSVSLALFVYSVITALSSHETEETYANSNTGVGLLLLLFAGYNLQIPYEHLLAILSLTILTELFQPFSSSQSSVASRQMKDKPIVHRPSSIVHRQDVP